MSLIENVDGIVVVQEPIFDEQISAVLDYDVIVCIQMNPLIADCLTVDHISHSAEEILYELQYIGLSSVNEGGHGI